MPDQQQRDLEAVFSEDLELTEAEQADAVRGGAPPATPSQPTPPKQTYLEVKLTDVAISG
jgi:hypothetical protein